MLEMMTSSILKKLNGSGLEIDPEVFQKLLASDGASGDQFGGSVAVSGDGLTVIVGASWVKDKGFGSGSAYIFTKQANGSYLEIQKLLASDGTADDLFGNSVAVSGDGSTIIIGAHRDDDKGNDSGSVYVFTKQENGSYLETQKLVASDGAARGYFGNSVAVSGDGSTIIIGAYGGADKGIYSGSAYVFTKQVNGSYLETQKLLASDRASNDFFGYSVAISNDGTMIIVGARMDDDKGVDSGSAYVFTKQANDSYLQTQKLVPNVGASDDQFGYSVAVSGDGLIVVVGVYGDDDKGSNSGSAYVFTKQTNGSYLQTQKLTAADGTAGDYFGWSVSVSADSSTVVAGVPQDGDKGNMSGSAYIFTKQTDGSYLQTQKLTAADGAAYNIFGCSVAASNTSVVVGAYNHLNKGAAYVY